MRKLYLLCLFSLVAKVYITYGQQINFAKGFGSWIADYSKITTVDCENNVYIAGNAYYALFDDFQMTHNGFFIAKFDTLGKVLWMFSANDTLNGRIKGITTDSHGNLFVVGDSPFLAKFNKEGELQWAKTYNLLGLNSVCTDKKDHVYVSGTYIDGMSIGPYALNSSFYSGALFVARFGNDGEVQSVVTAGGNGPNYAYRLKSDQSNNIYLTGSFTPNQAYFGDIQCETGISANCAFLAKMDSNMHFKWVRAGKLQENSTSVAGDLALDYAGHVYVLGGIYGVENMAEDSLFSNRSSMNIFILKYDSLGALITARTINSYDYNRDALDYRTFGGIATDRENNLYVASMFQNQLNIDRFSLNSKGQQDIYLVKFNEVGYPQWAKSYGGDHMEYISSLDISDSKRLYLTGDYRSESCDFDELEIINNSGNSMEDIFIASVKDTTETNTCPNYHPQIVSEKGYICHGDSLKITCVSDYIDTYNWFNRNKWVTSNYLSNLWVQDSGLYHADLNSGTRCPTVSDSLRLTMREKPPVSLEAIPDGILESHETIELSTTNADSLVYAWYLDGNLLENEFQHNLFTANSGYYRVNVDDGYCVNTDTLTIFKGKPLYIKDADPGDFLLFPNPTKAIATLILPVAFHDAAINLVSIGGRRLDVPVTHPDESKYNLDLSSLPDGAYFLEIKWQSVRRILYLVKSTRL